MLSLTCRTFLFADNCWICSLLNLFFPFGIHPIPSGQVHYTIFSIPFQSRVQAGASPVRSAGMPVHLPSERQGCPVLDAYLPVRSTGYSLTKSNCEWVCRPKGSKNHEKVPKPCDFGTLWVALSPWRTISRRYAIVQRIISSMFYSCGESMELVQTLLL